MEAKPSPQRGELEGEENVCPELFPNTVLPLTTNTPTNAPSFVLLVVGWYNLKKFQLTLEGGKSRERTGNDFRRVPQAQYTLSTLRNAGMTVKGDMQMKSFHSLPNTKYHILLRIGIALTVVGGLLMLMAPNAPASAGGRALQSTTEICGGECIEEEITFETGDLRIDRVDVVFLIDASGSMGDEIDQVQDQSMEIMDSVRALVSDSAFGVASFVDYSGFEDPDYGLLYGSGDDYPYRLDQDVTEDTAAIRSALNRIDLLYGNDTPESYSRALWEMQFLDWRKDSKRIVILFGDAYPHDRTFFKSGSSQRHTHVLPEQSQRILDFCLARLDGSDYPMGRYMSQVPIASQD